MRRWEAAIPTVSIARAVSVMPPPSLVRAEDCGARGDAILAVLVLEAVVVVALDVLEKFRALRRHHRAFVIVVGPDERRHGDVARGEEGHGGWWSGRACRLPPF
jgi:hypothetical protein